DPGSQSVTISSVGSSDAFVWKLTALGSLVWARDVGGSGSDVGNAVALDASGNLYVAGSFESTVDFDPGPGTTPITSNGGKDAFLLKLDSTGAFQWVKTFGGADDDAATAVAVDAAGNIFAAGTFKNSFDVQSGQAASALTSFGDTDVFLSKFDPSGNFVWARSFGGSGTEKAAGLALDGSGNAYVAGSFQQTASFSSGAISIAGRGSYDAFVFKMDSSGSPVWVQDAGGSNSNWGAGITLNGAGNPQVAGSFSGTSQ